MSKSWEEECTETRMRQRFVRGSPEAQKRALCSTGRVLDWVCTWRQWSSYTAAVTGCLVASNFIADLSAASDSDEDLGFGERPELLKEHRQRSCDGARRDNHEARLEGACTFDEPFRT